MDSNFLYYGDNLDVLRRHVKDESLDLVYLDPPFNSDVNYNVLFAEHGEKAAAQIEAFTDTWEWSTGARAAYEVVEAGGKTADTLRAFRTMIPGSDMLAYLSMMAPRLVELRRVLVGARVASSDKKGGDKGIDGRLYFHLGDGKTRQIVFSVKAGHLVPNDVRDLRGVIEREEAGIGVLLSFEEPSSGMRGEAAEAGFYTSPWGKHPRMQLLTVGELLAGKGIDYPHVTGSNVTLRRAQRTQGQQAVALPLFADAEPDEPVDTEET